MSNAVKDVKQIDSGPEMEAKYSVKRLLRVLPIVWYEFVIWNKESIS